jgi:hypothetical protein
MLNDGSLSIGLQNIGNRPVPRIYSGGSHRAPREWGAGRGVPSSLNNFCILSMKMMHFGAFLVGLE